MANEQSGLAAFRAQYPQYDDMSDARLADALYNKFYTDMPRADFDAKLGLKTEEPRSTLSTVDNVVRQAAGGIPILGELASKADAATYAAFPSLASKDSERPASEAPTFGERYSQNLETIHKADQRFAKENPVTSTAAGLAGGTAALAAAAGPLGAGRVLGLTGSSLPQMAAAGATSGAALSGGDAALRGENIAPAAGLGFLVGAAAPLAGAAIGKGVDAAIGATSKARQAFANPAEKKVAQAFGRDELKDPAAVNAALAERGSTGLLADVGPNTQALAETLAQQPGQAKKIVTEAIESRASGSRQRIDDAITQAFGPRQDIADITRDTIARRKAAADPLYEQFRAQKVHPTQPLKDLTPILEKDGLFANARHLMELEGKPVTVNFFTGGDRKNYPTTEAWDYVKQAIDGKIGEALKNNQRNVARVYSGLKRRLDAAIESHPDQATARVWKAARETYADPSRVMAAREEGQSVWGRAVRSDDLKFQLSDYSPKERAAFKEGARDGLARMMDLSINGDNAARRMLLAPENIAKMRLITDNAGATKLLKALTNESQTVEMSRNVLHNSRTAAREAAKEDLAGKPRGDFGIREAYAAGGVMGALRSASTKVMHKVLENAQRGKAHDLHADIAKILTAPASPERDATIQKIFNLAKQADPSGRVANQVRDAVTFALRGGQLSIGR